MQYSIVFKSKLDDIVFRFDAEYYHPDYINLEDNLQRFPSVSLRNAKAQLDCSAFYPSIVSYYNFEKNGIPFLRVNEIQNGLLHLTKDTVFLPEDLLNANKSTIARCQPGDLIIAKGGNTLAKIALLTDDYSVYSVCRDVIILRTSHLHKLNRFYLWIFLHSDIGQKLLLRTASQTGQPHLTIEAIYNIGIPTFSDVFQDEFEWLYDKSQKFLSMSQKKYHDAEDLLVSELGLLNWKPKHHLSFVKNYSDTQQAGRFDAEYYQPRYDDLLETIENYSQYTCRISPIQKYNARGLQPVYCSDGTLQVITSRHILETDLDYENFDHTNSSNWVDQSRARVYEGDILTYTTGANIGRTAVYSSNKPALASNHVNILRIEKENPEYVGFVMNSIVGRLQTERLSAGSAQAELYPKDIGSFVIPFIARDKQKEIVQRIDQSRFMKKKSKYMLESAKQAVEIAIEKDEETAMRWLGSQIGHIEGG